MKKIIIIIFFIIFFLSLRLPGISLPYHQDEWKNVSTSATIDSAGQFFTHPPLMQMSFVSAYHLFGQNNFRVFPLLFSIASGILLFFVVRNRIGGKVATWSILLFTICFYNIWGSLMTDVDGAIIPFFFLSAVYAYDKFNNSISSPKKQYWFGLLVVICFIGFLIKLNFILVVGVLIIDYVWNNWRQFTVKKASLFLLGIIGFSLIYIVLLYFIQAIYPAFNISTMFGHANQYTGVGRNWLQIVVQVVKAVFYLSPLLLIPLLFITKEIFKNTKIFFIYLITGTFFYLVLFDFSRGALDKYLMFSIVPLVIIIAYILEDIFKFDKNKNFKLPIVIGFVVSFVLIRLNFLPQTIVALYPKTEWFARVVHGEWDFLNPFNGGSGPMGFYVSFVFIIISFIISIILGFIGKFKRELRYGVVIILIMIGMVYNFVFAEELLFGKINGSAPQVLHDTVAFIEKSDLITSVMTYNDTGNQYLSEIGKYAGRIYAVPEYESNYIEKFSKFDGQFMIIDIPHLYENGFYGRYFSSCNVMFETLSGKISGKVYNCPNSKDLIYNL